MDSVSSQTNYIVVPPITPNDPATIRKISRLLADDEQIQEAHLPCIIEFGESSRAQPALFVIVAEHSDKKALHKMIDHKLNGGFFRRKSIAVKVINSDYPILHTIRDANCLIGWRG